MTRYSNPAMQMLVRFNHKFEIRACEWLNACILFLWGVILLTVPKVFETGFNYYWTLERLFSQPTWGVACLTVGGARLVALYINGARRSTPFIRMSMAFISCFFWYQIALGLALSGVVNTGLAVYPLLLVFEVYNVFRATIDARSVYDQSRAHNNGTDRK